MERIDSSPAPSKDGALINELLTEFQLGYSLENLRPLIGVPFQFVSSFAAS